MPFNFGSSSVNLPQGPTGDTGPSGAIGATGNTGNTGECFRGSTGSGVTDVAIVGLTLQITYGTGGYTLDIPMNVLLGVSGSTSSNLTQYNIKGITTNGYSIINTKTPTEFLYNSATYDILLNGNYDVAKFRGLSFDGITYTNTSDTITLTNITTTSTSVSTATIGQLVFVSDTNLIGGAKNSEWDNATHILSYLKPATREADISGYTLEWDNYRKTDILPLPSESSYSAMATGGFTFSSTLARPVSTIDGTTHQSALYINGTGGAGITGRSIIYFGGQTGTYGTTFSPQTSGITYGSCCLPSGKCIEYATSQYCALFSGSTFSAGMSCATTKCGYKSCCFYDIVSDGVTCIDAPPLECVKFLGVTGASLCAESAPCADLCCTPPSFTLRSSMLTSVEFEEDYSIRGRCCFGGKCYYIKTNSTKTQYIPTVSELVFIGYDTCDSFVGACCTGGDCYLANSITCNDLGGSFLGADSTCKECTS